MCGVCAAVADDLLPFNKCIMWRWWMGALTQPHYNTESVWPGWPPSAAVVWQMSRDRLHLAIFCIIRSVPCHRRRCQWFHLHHRLSFSCYISYISCCCCTVLLLLATYACGYLCTPPEMEMTKFYGLTCEQRIKRATPGFGMGVRWDARAHSKCFKTTPKSF